MPQCSIRDIDSKHMAIKARVPTSSSSSVSTIKEGHHLMVDGY